MLIRRGENDTVRFEIPHEPGEWIELRRLPWGRLKTYASSGLSEAEVGSAMLVDAIAGWSYDAEVTPEHVDCLDPATATWVGGQLEKLLGVDAARGEDSAAA